MRVLVVGGGGREHALAWGLLRSKQVTELWTAGGNAGICQIARPVDAKGQGVQELAEWAAAHRIDLTVVGPEAQLTMGIVDAFRARGLSIVGPTQAAATIESSKSFAKELMVQNGIPTARFVICDSAAAARRQARQMELPLVIKADGLAAGKGVVICHTWDEVEAAIGSMMEEQVFGEAGKQVVIEEFLTGPEVSVLAFMHGTDVVAMPAAQDHKAVGDGDQGPNTGGMGAYSPVPGCDAAFLQHVTDTVLQPAAAAMVKRGTPFTGVLFAGLMLTPQGVRVLEFNCRFGDPETQVLIPRLASDLADVLSAVAEGRLREVEVRWLEKVAVCVVLASGGYPGHYETGLPISGLAEAEKLRDTYLFHAGTKMVDSAFATAGGRVLGVTALGDTHQAAIDRAYQAVARISFPGMHFRRDIGRRALNPA